MHDLHDGTKILKRLSLFKLNFMGFPMTIIGVVKTPFFYASLTESVFFAIMSFRRGFTIR